MKMVTPTILDLTKLAYTLRGDEKRQWEAVTGLAYDPELAAANFVATPGVKFCLLDDDGNPVAAGGYTDMGHGVWKSWMVGTQEGWDNHWRTITKNVRKVMDAMFAGGARRLETEAAADRKAAHVWYVRSLKMKMEGVHVAKYADGSDMVSFGRTA